jgi:putative colanic acid biosynthesis acetyltransferase WcaF
VKFPWRLRVGDFSWIGEDVWIDNLAEIEIADHCCISQGAYLCTGSHDWSSMTFDLIVRPIEIQRDAWIAAKAAVGPGVVVREGAVLTLGGVANHDLEAWTIYSGTPAVPVRLRHVARDRKSPNSGEALTPLSPAATMDASDRTEAPPGVRPAISRKTAPKA